MSAEAVVKAAMSVAKDAAEGRLDPATLDAALREEVATAFGTVAGPGDVLWPTQVGVARAVLALGGIDADELAEWLSVARSRVGAGFTPA